MVGAAAANLVRITLERAAAPAPKQLRRYQLVFARVERHNHNAVFGLRAAESKRCEPMSPFGRSGDE